MKQELLKNVTKQRNNTGITLIALVITIIVLLILAGVSIAMLTGQNGILTRAQDAKTNTEIAEEKEAIGLAYNGVMAENRGNGVSSGQLQTELVSNGYNAKVTDNGDGTLNVFFEDSKNNYNVNDGTITKVEPLVAGLYDSNRNQIVSWDDLVNNYGLDISKNYSSSNLPTGYWKNPSSLYYILKNNSELSGGIILVVDDSIETIGQYALTTSQLISIQLPDNITSIGARAFSNCKSLTNITIPDNITSIGASAFSNCTSLTNITIPDSVTTIEEYVFSNCTSLTNITIPDSVTSIGRRAFDSCTSLSNVTISNNIQVIEYGTFSNCTSLDNLKIPNSVETIASGNGDYSGAFSKCTSLKNIEMPNNLKFIGKFAFQGCTSLESIFIPDSVTTIEGYAFSECTSLSNIYIPTSVTSMLDNANQSLPLFEGCELDIYCGASSIPDGWGDKWNLKTTFGTEYIEPKLGYTREQYELEVNNQ